MPIPHTNLNFSLTKNSRTKINAQRFLNKFKSASTSQNTYQAGPGKRQNDSSLKSPKVCYYNSANCLCQVEMPQNPRWLTVMRNKANMPNYSTLTFILNSYVFGFINVCFERAVQFWKRQLGTSKKILRSHRR